MKTRIRFFLLITCFVLLCLACLNSKPKTESTPSLSTLVALTLDAIHAEQTAVADATRLAILPTSTAVPQVNTALPTLIPSSTAPTIPCNEAKFVGDVTIPDATEMLPNEAFTKTWRIKNTGSCTWTTAYQIVYFLGDKMSVESSVPLTTNVAPGATVDLSVNLTSPTAAGSFTTFYKLRAGDGTVFGLGSANDPFYVSVRVIKSPPSVISDPDLTISGASINNGNPILLGVPVEFSAKVCNIGQLPASDFFVEVFAVEGSGSNDCDWKIFFLEPQDCVTLSCDLTFFTAHPGLNALFVVDRFEAVKETNETNNKFRIPLQFP